MPSDLPKKIVDQIEKAYLPTGGRHPFRPNIVRNAQGEQQIEKREVKKGPKKGKRGYVDEQGRIWIKDRAHSTLPDHWDVQEDEGEEYLRVDFDGEEL